MKKYIVFTTLCVLLTLSACGKKVNSDTVQIAKEVYQTAVTVQKTDESIPVVVAQEPDTTVDVASKIIDTAVNIAPSAPPDVISVPGLGQLELEVVVPPSTKPTVVKTYKKKVGIVKKLLTNAQTHNVISSTPGVTAKQPSKSLWKRWAVLITVILLIAAVIFKKTTSFDVFDTVKKLIGRRRN